MSRELSVTRHEPRNEGTGRWLLARQSVLVQGPLPRSAAPLAWLGRWSLSWYMLHQPVLFGILLSMR